jgi:hypothetical protein
MNAMSLPTIFDLCTPRQDVRDGSISDSDFAANLSRVLRGDATPDDKEPKQFFANTYPTEGLKELLVNVCRRLSGRGQAISAVFRLDTSFGGGKTHGLIALVHAARGMPSVENVAEFLDPTLVPKGKVRIAAFDGENADAANGRPMDDGIRAFTPWGKIAYQLAGKAGYEIVRRSGRGEDRSRHRHDQRIVRLGSCPDRTRPELNPVENSSCAITGSPTVSSSPTTISSTTAARHGTSSPISHGASCQSDCANGRTGSD